MREQRCDMARLHPDFASLHPGYGARRNGAEFFTVIFVNNFDFL